MYKDNESIKVFERQHARDRLTQIARERSDLSGADLDLMSAHCGPGATATWLIPVSIVVLLALAAIGGVGLA